MLDLGFRTHDFGRKFDNADQIGEIVSGYRKNACLHFAPYKVLDNAPKPMNDKWASDTRKALSAHGVRVAILGCYVNPVHPDPEVLKQELQKFENGLDIADSADATLLRRGVLRPLRQGQDLYDVGLQRQHLPAHHQLCCLELTAMREGKPYYAGKRTLDKRSYQPPAA